MPLVVLMEVATGSEAEEAAAMTEAAKRAADAAVCGGGEASEGAEGVAF